MASGAIVPMAALEGGAKSQQQIAREKEIYCMLHEPMRIAVKDGRVFEGSFLCFDNEGNIILRETYVEMGETMKTDKSATCEMEQSQSLFGGEDGRTCVGSCMIANKHIVSVSVKTLAASSSATM